MQNINFFGTTRRRRGRAQCAPSGGKDQVRGCATAQPGRAGLQLFGIQPNVPPDHPGRADGWCGFAIDENFETAGVAGYEHRAGALGYPVGIALAQHAAEQERAVGVSNLDPRILHRPDDDTRIDVVDTKDAWLAGRDLHRRGGR